MASNDTQPSHIMETVSSSLLEWVRVGLLPYIVISFNIVIIMLGIILNIILMVMFKRWKHYKNPGSMFIIQMAVADILACMICLPLSTMAAILKAWPLPDIVCSGFGIASRWFYHLSFGFLIFCAIERAVLFGNTEIHGRTFGRGVFVACVCVIVYIETLAISVLPLLPFEETGTLTYDQRIYQCGVIQGSSHIILNLDFSTSIFASLVIYFICAIVIFRARRKLLATTADSQATLEMRPQSAGNENGITDSEDRRDTSRMSMMTHSSRSSSPSIMVSIEEVLRPRTVTPRPRRFQKLKTAGEMVVNVLKDNKNDAAYHMAITYVLTWSLVATLWSVQHILTYIEVYGDIPIWGGAHIIAIMFGTLSYCVKPIVYLSHNRNFQRQTKSVLPKVVKETASKVKDTLSSTVDRIDRAVFDPHLPRRLKYPKRVGSADSTRRLDVSGQLSRSSTELPEEMMYETRARGTHRNGHSTFRSNGSGARTDDVDW